MTIETNTPVAILDKELAKYPGYTIAAFEFCDNCGARFGIGYHRECRNRASSEESSGELPKRLREILKEDHGHDRKHKAFTEIWAIPG